MDYLIRYSGADNFWKAVFISIETNRCARNTAFSGLSHQHKIDDCGPCDGYIQFIRIDDSGDTIRTFNIPNLGNEQGPVSTLFLNDQHLVIAANNTNGITNQVALINSDTLGNIFWSYVLSDPLYDYSANAMIKIDSNYLITGMRSVPGSPQLTRTFLLSVSKAGNFNWLNSYGNPYENFATGLRLQNEEYILQGQCLIQSDRKFSLLF